MHISHFLLKIYYLLLILYLFYTMEMMLYKKQIWAIFLFELQLATSATHLAQ